MASLEELRRRVEGQPGCACSSCVTRQQVSRVALRIAAGIAVAREELLADKRTSRRRVPAKLHDAATELVGLVEALNGAGDGE